MSDRRPLSYNVLKCILENLTIEKRIELVKNCPTIRSAERRANLQLDRLVLNDSTLTVNDVKYHIYDEMEETSCLDVRRGDEEFFSDDFKMGSRKLRQTILNFYLADRGMIKVRRLETSCPTLISLGLPEGLQIECEELKLNGRLRSFMDQQLAADQLASIQAIKPFLTSNPLGKVFVHVNKAPDPIFQEELVRNAEYLEIEKDSSWGKSIVTDLYGLNCNHVHVQTGVYCFDKQDVVKLARVWLETCPKSTTRFTLTVSEYEYVLDVMDLLIGQFGAVRGQVLEEELRNTFFRHCVTVPMQSGQELNLFGGLPEKRSRDANWLLRMEIMEPGSSKRK